MKQYIVKVVTEGDDGQVWEFLVRNSDNLQQKRNSDCGFFEQYEPDLIDKDVNYIREAYPRDTTATRKLPRYYAIFDASAFIVGPTPDQSYSAELHYGYYPESIVTAGTTWLGNEFDSALLNGALVEAIRFMKGEQDLVGQYQQLYVQAIGLLKNLGDGKLRQDTYRNVQVRNPVS